MADAPAGGAGIGNPLTEQYGALKGWQWAAIIGGLGGAFLYLHARSKGAGSSTTATTGAPIGSAVDAYGNPIPGREILAPIIIQNGGGSTGGTTGTKPTPAPPKPGPPKPQPNPSTKVNSKDFSQSIAANSPTGKTLTSVGSIQNGKYVGKNTASGAPVYALIDTGYGPKTSFVQSWNAAKLPNGTKIFTLPQFKGLFK